jgi:hypothetical protein
MTMPWDGVLRLTTATEEVARQAEGFGETLL